MFSRKWNKFTGRPIYTKFRAFSSNSTLSVEADKDYYGALGISKSAKP